MPVEKPKKLHLRLIGNFMFGSIGWRKVLTPPVNREEWTKVKEGDKEFPS